MRTRKLQVAVAPLVAAALIAAAAGAVALSASPLLPKASAYVLSNGCDEYDPARALYYRCTPDRSTFYTPDGVDPNRVYAGTGYSGEKATGSFRIKPSSTYNDPGGIPPPAPFSSGKDYCSNGWLGWSPFEAIWQRACYNHDVCYGSQLGRKYCDVRFWRNMISACKSHYGWYDPRRYACFADAIDWYTAVRAFGSRHYKPRKTSFEP